MKVHRSIEILGQLFLLLSICHWVRGQQDSGSRKFEYKYSFKPPYLSQKDGTIPFWEHFGNAIASEENLRVTPSLRSQKGSVWGKLQTNFEWWEVELVFRVTGRGRIGADGLAFWFTNEKGREGPVFGSNDQWNGLGIFFDSFDNDNKHNNPYIMAMVNDGNKLYDHQNDGSTQQIAGCLRDFRNKPFPVRAKITYFKNVLLLMFNNGMSNNENEYEMCMRVENVFLPHSGFFGISAATGGLADDHDVQKFMTWSILSSEMHSGDPMIDVAEQQRFEQEYEKYQDELKKKKDEYIKDHPDAQQKKDDDEDWFEEEQNREIGWLLKGQSEVRALIQNLGKKLDEIVGRQETTISLVSSLQASGLAIGGQVPPVGQGQGQGQVPPVGGTGAGIQRHEVDNILASARELIQTTRDMKNLLTAISSKEIPHQGASYGGYDMAAAVNELKDGINIVKRDVNLVNQKVHQPSLGGGVGGDCPTVNCVTVTTFIAIAVFQVVALLGYAFYKNSKESQAKKFY